MERPSTVRRVRIAVSATCAVACVALILLWVRSNWYFDGLETLTTSRLIRVWSVDGRLALEQTTPPRIPTMNASLREAILREMSWGRAYLCQPIGWSGGFLHAMGEHVMGFGYSSGSMQAIITGPHWAFVWVFGVLAVTPWVPWSRRFSLRTLLIVTTVVAVVLGLVVVMR